VSRGTYYTYDIDGNVSSLWQQLDGLYEPITNAGLKRIDYEYDLVSGKVNFVRYQDGQQDAFYYGYNYDADNRITGAWTSPVALVDTLTGSYLMAFISRQDAQYYYYLHGPLRRMELGTQGLLLQGMDYAYTLQGWLKGVNSADGTTAADMGQDGIPGSKIAADNLAYSLGYYTGDYNPIGGTADSAFALKYSQTTGDITGQSLYNGNISNRTMKMMFVVGIFPPVGYTYHYDQLNRLKKMRYYTGITGTGWSRSNISLDYQENITYDGNGNILTYGRNGDESTAQTIDSLTYNYNYTGGKLQNNKLNYINDAIDSSGYTLDLRNQTSTTNYQYDATGNLLSDAYAGITNTDWTVYNKPDTIFKSAGNITYAYNTANQRISKTYGGVTTWYVRDAQGNVLAVYDSYGGNVIWREQDLYGSSRLGIWTPNLLMNGASEYTPWVTAGLRHYELDNHLGNVITTIADVRAVSVPGPRGYYGTLPLSWTDYYPFGMPMPDRYGFYTGLSPADTTYRYGFNGKENDNEVMGYGNSLDYGDRFEDVRSGRFRSVDLLFKKYPSLTPYQDASNSPISNIDVDGLERYHYTLTLTSQGKPVLKPGRKEDFTEAETTWNPTLTNWFRTETKFVKNPRVEYVVHGVADVPIGIDGTADISEQVTWTFPSYHKMKEAEAAGGPGPDHFWAYYLSDQRFSIGFNQGLIDGMQAQTETSGVGQAADNEESTLRSGMAPKSEEVVVINLRMKEGWTPEQQIEARNKVDLMNNLKPTVVENPVERAANLRRGFLKEGGDVNATQDVDHILDLQLGGTNDLFNLQGLDQSVNRSLGKQIQNQIQNVAPGTKVKLQISGP